MYLFFSSRKTKQQYMYHSRVQLQRHYQCLQHRVHGLLYFMEIALSIAYTYNRQKVTATSQLNSAYLVFSTSIGQHSLLSLFLAKL